MTAFAYLVPFMLAATYAEERLKDIPLPPDYCKNGGVFVNVSSLDLFIFSDVTPRILSCP